MTEKHPVKVRAKAVKEKAKTKAVKEKAKAVKEKAKAKAMVQQPVPPPFMCVSLLFAPSTQSKC